MIHVDLDKLKKNHKILVICDSCGNDFYRIKKTILSSRKIFAGKDLCRSCSAKIAAGKRPQNSKEYWLDKKESHGQVIKNSKKYQEGIKNRDTSGPKNGMYGRKASIETRQKMSKSRTGKLGPNATAWKGGKLSITKRVKSAQQRMFKWFSRIFERDDSTCQKCGSKEHLDIHHIIPLVRIIKELLEQTEKEFQNDEKKIEWLLAQSEIIDKDLENGVVLCRTCHRLEHKNWGSKINP